MLRGGDRVLPALGFARIFFFNDTATTEIYTLSLHDALPISRTSVVRSCASSPAPKTIRWSRRRRDRKSTRLNSSHLGISYAVFCLKKQKQTSVISLSMMLVGRLLMTSDLIVPNGILDTVNLL